MHTQKWFSLCSDYDQNSTDLHHEMSDWCPDRNYGHRKKMETNCHVSVLKFYDDQVG